MELHTEHQYEAEPETVFAMLTDPEFLRAKLMLLGHRDIEIVECAPDRIITRRTVPLDVPGFLRKVISPANTVVQTDEWGPERGGVREGRWQVDVKGVPITMSGVMWLEATGDGVVEVIQGHAKSSVPLLGGRLERFAADSTLWTLAQEHEFAKEWLAGL